jgi:hypothetical protein
MTPPKNLVTATPALPRTQVRHGALAWSLKAWIALLVPVSPRWAATHLEQRRRLLTMDFRTFVAAFIHIPCQIIRAARRIQLPRTGVERMAGHVLSTTRRSLTPASHVDNGLRGD